MKWEQWVAGVVMSSTLTMAGCSTYNPGRVNHQQLEGGYSYWLLDPPLYKGDACGIGVKMARTVRL